MLRKALTCALLAAAVVAAGCGGSDESTSEADEGAIRELVTKVNEAAANKDASAFCLLFQPSGIEATFHDIDRCVSETRQILKNAGEQPELRVESIEVDGDQATVTFAGNTLTEYNVVKEGGHWYWPIDPGDVGADPPGEETGA